MASDTPITDSLAFVNLDDAATCRDLERLAVQMAEAIAKARQRAMQDFGLTQETHFQQEAQEYRKALAAWRELQERTNEDN